MNLSGSQIPFPVKCAFYQVKFQAKGAFSIVKSEHMYNIYLRMRDEVERQVASLGKIICVPLTGVHSDICLLVMTPTSLY